VTFFQERVLLHQAIHLVSLGKGAVLHTQNLTRFSGTSTEVWFNTRNGWEPSKGHTQTFPLVKKTQRTVEDELWPVRNEHRGIRPVAVGEEKGKKKKRVNDGLTRQLPSRIHNFEPIPTALITLWLGSG